MELESIGDDASTAGSQGAAYAVLDVLLWLDVVPVRDVCAGDRG